MSCSVRLVGCFVGQALEVHAVVSMCSCKLVRLLEEPQGDS